MRMREPLTVTARMCSSQDCIGKDKADGVSIERETNSTIRLSWMRLRKIGLVTG